MIQRRAEAGALGAASRGATVQRTVMVASSVDGMAQDVQNHMAGGAVGWKAAYTLLQHLDWALGLAGPDVVEFENADLSQALSPLLIIEHGEQGLVGTRTAPAIIARLVDAQTGLPQNWAGRIYITSCHAGEPTQAGANDSVAALVQAGVRARADLAQVTVTGYAGETVTHRRFGNRLFEVVNRAAWDPISDAAMQNPANGALLQQWAQNVLAHPPQTMAELTALAQATAQITDPIYAQLVNAAPVGTLAEHQIQ